jgi:hypothetical protein
LRRPKLYKRVVEPHKKKKLLDIPATAVCTSPLLGLKDLTVHNCGISDDDYVDDTNSNNNNGCNIE